MTKAMTAARKDQMRADAKAVQGVGLVTDALAAQWYRAATLTSWACTLLDPPVGSSRRVTFTAGTPRPSGIGRPWAPSPC